MKKYFLFIIFLLTISVQSQTIQDVKDLINTNLASGTKITAEKHREVENAIVSLIENKIFLYKGNHFVGDPTSSDSFQTITFPSVGTSNYLVVGSLVSNGSNYDDDNDVIWSIKDKTSTSFKLLLRELAARTQNLNFNYALIPY